MASTSPRSPVELPYAKNLQHGGVERKTSSSLTFSRRWLQHVARETADIAQKGYYINGKGDTVSIKEDLQKAMDGSVHYHSSYVFTPPASSGHFQTQFLIATGSSLQVATQLYGDDSHVGILNSASAKTPDKFLRGTISQEECISRASLLSTCLRQYENQPHHFYEVNRKEKYHNNASSCAIFCPKVPVIRRDSVQGELLDHYELCSFVSIPAANAFVVGRKEHEESIPKAQPAGALEAGLPHEHETLYQAMYDRIFRALCIFQQHGCTDLVLCAFGCGVHGNNPETVAKIFHDILHCPDQPMWGQFRTVLFAVSKSRPGNFKAFQKVFPDAITQRPPNCNPDG